MWAGRIFQPVFFLLRIEMTASGYKAWGFARGVLVNVNGMLAGRQILEIERDLHSTDAIRGESCGPYALALSILEIDRSGLSGKHTSKEADAAKKADCLEHTDFLRIAFRIAKSRCSRIFEDP